MRVFALALVVVPIVALADVVSPAPESVRVTIYRNPAETITPYSDEADSIFDFSDPAGLVMVSETRTVEIPAGDSKVVFLGVADAIVPQTAAIEGLAATVLESNFDYDLLTPGAVIAKSHGEHVRLVRTDPATGRTTERDALIRTGPDGVVLDVDGKTEALGCSALNEKLVFSRVPAGLADEPRLSMTVRAATAGKHTVQLSYLALGMEWSADYVARINADDNTLALTGWLTLVNHAGTTFANTPAEVIAGNLAWNPEETKPPGPNTVPEDPRCWPIGSFVKWAQRGERMFKRALTAPLAFGLASRNSVSVLQETVVTGSRIAEMRELGDYKLYAVPEPTTIAPRQSKQVQFLSQLHVPFKRVYEFIADDDSIMGDNDFEPRRPRILLRMQNKASDGLGKPLPLGVISVMERGGSGEVLAGQDNIQDIPVGLPVELELGLAMDVWIEPRVTEERTVGVGDHKEQRVSMEVRLGNDKPVPITLEYRQPGGAQNFRILRESRSHTLKDGDIRWTFQLRPGARTVLRYSMQQSD